MGALRAGCRGAVSCGPFSTKGRAKGHPSGCRQARRGLAGHSAMGKAGPGAGPLCQLDLPGRSPVGLSGDTGTGQGEALGRTSWLPAA